MGAGGGDDLNHSDEQVGVLDKGGNSWDVTHKKRESARSRLIEGNIRSILLEKT